MRKRVDDSQRAIVEVFRKCGALWIPTSGDPTIGYDGIIAYRGKLEIIEIKDGSKPPSARKLTDRERARKAELEAKGCAYNIVCNVDDALALIAAMR